MGLAATSIMVVVVVVVGMAEALDLTELYLWSVGWLDGCLGVYFDKTHRNPWRAKLRVDKKGLYLGSFATEKEAAMAYKQAYNKYFKQTPAQGR